jgi:hypothetical protein
VKGFHVAILHGIFAAGKLAEKQKKKSGRGEWI